MKCQDRGFDTPLLNKTLFRKIRYFMGGKVGLLLILLMLLLLLLLLLQVSLLLSGGAPLSGDTHSLCRTCMSTTIMQVGQEQE